MRRLMQKDNQPKLVGVILLKSLLLAHQLLHVWHRGTDRM